MTVPTKFVTAGGWRTLEWLWNSPAVIGEFVGPAGAQIKVRYGGGWPFGRDRQRQSLDGRTAKRLSIGRWSVVVARMQITVPTSQNVTYELFFPGP
jgi:hypothetical protein